MRQRINNLIEQILPFCESWLQQDKDGLDRFVDPNDKEEISAHYGATHAAAAFIIWGKQTNNDALYIKGVSLLDSILTRWGNSITLPAFHFDFNNLAICMVENLVDGEIGTRIRNIVINTPDSNHDTINWLPMRWAVNRNRIEWTQDNRFETTIAHCKSYIAKATNVDGGIEDRLPHGSSFNLQYDLATVAVLQYLRIQGEVIDLSKQLGFLLNAVAPDGDINYQGRGTNQIYAWGLWIYLLASSGREIELSIALDYLTPRLSEMLENNSMMLNSWKGTEKYLWWDYHYTSVYTAHCLLWLILALHDYGKATISPIVPTTTETGLHIHSSDNVFVSWFEGRSEYLAEKGPAIACIWTKKSGIVCKGTFGPWQGLFGNKYIYEDIVLNNFFGLLETRKNKDLHQSRFLRRLFPNYHSEESLLKRPCFSLDNVDINDGYIEIKYCINPSKTYIVNLPVWSNYSFIDVYAENDIVTLSHIADFRSQYQFIHLLASKTITNINHLIIRIRYEY